MNNLKIIAAAIKSEHDGIVYQLPQPARHSDIIFMLAEVGFPTPIKGEQGFITTNGQFVDRRLAFSIAYLANQITQEQYDRRKDGSYKLFSEDVWKGHFFDHYLNGYKNYLNKARKHLFASKYDQADWCFERARNIWIYKLNEEYKLKALGE